MSDITFKMTAETNVGLVRTNNEDNFIVNPDPSKENNWFVPADAEEVINLGENGCILVVADGMGGMNAGEVASDLAVTSIRDSFSKVKDFSSIQNDPDRIESFLKKIVVEADASIKKRLKEDPETSGMGTTLVVAWVVNTTVHIVWCGDSRAYLFKPDSGIIRLTKDHSYVQELVDSGKLDAELAFDHPNSNIITRSLGDSPSKAQPDYVCRELQKGDILLLCSDGLCGLCRDEEIGKVMSASAELGLCRDNLIEAALNAGGYDNVTVALMEVVSLGKEDDIHATATINDLKSVKIRKRKTRIMIFFIVLIALAALLIYNRDRFDFEKLMDSLIPKKEVSVSGEEMQVEEVTETVDSQENTL
ncbi:MAG: serine/threonine-protein phosphatase [Bacteroidales bacterium]|nr:serine/threonine-protein phosphatase [Bacteroidales bacterium]